MSLFGHLYLYYIEFQLQHKGKQLLFLLSCEIQLFPLKYSLLEYIACDISIYFFNHM